MSQPAPAGESSNAQLDLEPEPKTTERLEEEKQQLEQLEGKQQQPEQLDGGYGWLIVFGAWLTFFWVFGLFYSFGVLFTSFLCPKEGEGSLGDGSLPGDAGVCEDGGFGASRGVTSLLQGVAMATMNGTGWLGGALVDRWGQRRIIIAAAALGTSSILAASFCTNIIPMLLTYGIGAGLANMLAFIAAGSLVPAWFSARRSYAQGWAFTGSGMSNAILPPVLHALVEAWGWRVTLRACAAAIAVFWLTAAAIFRPPPAAAPGGGAPKSAEQKPKPKFACCDKLLVRDPVMLVTLACIGVAAMGFFAPFAHIVKYAVEEGPVEQRLTEAQGGQLLLAMGISNTIARPVSGKIADNFGALHTFALSAMVAGALTIALPFLHGMPLLCAYAVLFGFFGGGFVALFMPLNVELFGVANIARASGLCQIGFGVGAALSAPVAGWIFDGTQEYTASFLLAGGLFLLGGTLLEVLPKRFLDHPAHLALLGKGGSPPKAKGEEEEKEEPALVPPGDRP